MGTRRRLAAGGATLALVVASLTGLAGVATAAPPPFRFATATPMPRTPLGLGMLDGLSCPTPTSCVAVGGNAPGRAGWASATERGGTWRWGRFEPLPVVAVSPDWLTSVSCPTPTSCVAVGFAQDGDVEGSDTTGFALTTSATVHGGRWRWSVPVPLAAGSTGVDRLASISCSSATSCVAVGRTVHEQGISASAERRGARWSWSAATIVAPDATGFGELLSVSCPVPTACVAVGDDNATYGLDPGGPGAGVATVATRSGTGWTWSTQQPIAGGVSTDTSLSSVSCPMPSRCVAVGAAPTGSGATVGRRDAAGTWVWGAPVAFAGEMQYSQAFDSPVSVSCVPSRCVAVGEDEDGDGVYTEAPGPLPVASWSRTRAVPRDGLLQPEPGAVSCPLADDCVQVGVAMGERAFASATLAAPGAGA